MNEPISSWVVYDHPKDYPDQYVARMWDGEAPTTNVILGPTLESVREPLRRDYVCVGRFAQDDPCIVEVWL